MAPHKRIFLVLLSEVKLGNQAIVSSSEEDCRKFLAELKGSHIFVEALGELASLLHLPQVPEHYFL